MTWEETIEYIRAQAKFKDLVRDAYFEEKIEQNIERFKQSGEFIETLQLIKRYQPTAQKILDIGCGNGISSISFALNGYNVVAVEPDPSETIGAGAIRKMKEHYHLDNIEIYESYAEDIAFDSNSFDVVYIRQAMHHANDLNKFIGEAGRVLKQNGLLLTVRDHVVFDEKDKEWFLETHPLHKYYGGENAYHPNAYKSAMESAGLKIIKELKYFDSVINFFPIARTKILKLRIIRRILQHLPGPIIQLLPKRLKRQVNALDERKVPGRMYSYIARK